MLGESSLNVKGTVETTRGKGEWKKDSKQSSRVGGDGQQDPVCSGHTMYQALWWVPLHSHIFLTPVR